MEPEIFLISLRNLRRRRLRTFFTMLGVIIAIGAITALVAITEGFQVGVQKTLQSTGNVVIVMPGMGASIMSIATETMSQSYVRKVEGIPHVVAVNPVLLKFALFEYKGVQLQITVMGVIPRNGKRFYALTGPPIERGQFFPQGSSYKVVLGYSIANGKFMVHGRWMNWMILPGQTVKIYDPSGNPFEFKVSGSLQQSGQAFIAGFIDDSVLVPLGTLQSIYGDEGRISFIELVVDNVRFVGYVKRTIEREVPDVTVVTERQVVEDIVSVENMLSNLLLGVGSVALLVGALGVINTLLTSVMERTREIGTYRALGARRRFILEMIFIEGLTLTFIGGLVGFLSGIGLADLIVWILRSRGQMIPWPVVDLRVIGIAFGVTFIVGILSSLYPANRAAELSPAEALRHAD